ncbi:MAG: hypothetical protein ACRENA_05390 [Vulcanimicrobiaceae bacterium]
MTYDEVEPFIRSWVEVTLIGEELPRFRGMLRWAGGTISVFIDGAPEDYGGDRGEPLPTKMSISINKIATITLLADPPWLLELNKADAVASAEMLLQQERRPKRDG